MKNKRWIGVFYALISAAFWGIGGTVAQYLFQQQHVDVNWFVTVRLLIGGTLLVGSQLLLSKPILNIWKTKRDASRLLIFSIVGMLLVQYSYMISIALGNAAMATLLQYLAPVFIILFYIMTKQQPFTKLDAALIFFTIIGTFLLLTNGDTSSLSVPVAAIVWGIISGLALAFYTLYAKPLLETQSSILVVGWAMLVAGFVFNFVAPFWQTGDMTWGTPTIVGLTFSIVCGTALAFWLFVASLNYISPKETSIFGTFEPLTAVVSSIVWLALPFGLWQFVGALCIIGMVLALSLLPKKA
ncbi:MAG: DMT family transporter [Caryophanon sp.]|nr:DMT family transporter [Caryophanon sp.]